MISRSFSLSDFFAAIDGMNYFEATIAARQDVQAADSLSSRVKGAILARQQGSGHYADILRKYLFFLQSGTKPSGIMDEDFALFFPSCKRFVEEDSLKPVTLQAFAEHINPD